jgi:hypothetical protein
VACSYVVSPEFLILGIAVVPAGASWIADALTLYFNIVVAFWQGMVRIGSTQLLLIGLALWWFFGRGCCGCGECRCWCGRCRCNKAEVKDDD